jgi:hypothetical protein
MAVDQRSVVKTVSDLAASGQPDWAWDILDSLDAQLAVIDHSGIIRYVNAAWTRSAAEDGGNPASMGVGVNYLAACQPDVLDSLVAILNGECEHFEFEYECGLPLEERWYVMRAMPLIKQQPGWAVITHHNITRRKRVASDEIEAERQQEQAREQDSLAKLSVTAPAPMTAQAFGMRALRDGIPDAFERFVEYYGDLLEHAVQARTYKGEPPLPPRLRVLADQLVFLKAGPRDVIDIHMAALRQRTVQASPGEARAYAEEARLLVLELMGHLAATYRSQAFGIKLSDAEARSL